MLIDMIKAVLFVGLPVGVFSYVMMYYAYKNGYLTTDIAIEDAFKKHNQEYVSLSRKNKKELRYFHSKWISFGGGFYGLVALLTFIIIELLQFTNFWLGVTGWHDVAALFTLDSLINMFIDAIKNMVAAAVWFTYWPDVFDTPNFIAWILVAYAGYRLGANFAKKHLVTQRKCKLNAIREAKIKAAEID
ncbi:hypothetical protein [Litorilituus lipolyticus]|uniref:Uncharacterized protein n=1 Tax=Litorilituus lipolyticus TaxID=2491017 RepID=A0A502KKY9_9GAMM|nr:hypothetical protein [Litorilituus lipolyticus]TPH12096.1 hypothetical protein EPA86_17215 [Litorilituus lipolyticus]